MRWLGEKSAPRVRCTPRSGADSGRRPAESIRSGSDGDSSAAVRRYEMGESGRQAVRSPSLETEEQLSKVHRAPCESRERTAREREYRRHTAIVVCWRAQTREPVRR